MEYLWQRLVQAEDLLVSAEGLVSMVSRAERDLTLLLELGVVHPNFLLCVSCFNTRPSRNNRQYKSNCTGGGPVPAGPGRASAHAQGREVAVNEFENRKEVEDRLRVTDCRSLNRS